MVRKSKGAEAPVDSNSVVDDELIDDDTPPWEEQSPEDIAEAVAAAEKVLEEDITAIAAAQERVAAARVTIATHLPKEKQADLASCITAFHKGVKADMGIEEKEEAAE